MKRFLQKILQTLAAFASWVIFLLDSLLKIGLETDFFSSIRNPSSLSCGFLFELDSWLIDQEK